MESKSTGIKPTLSLAGDITSSVEGTSGTGLEDIKISARSLSYMEQEYHELLDLPVLEKSALEVLNENVSRLENLVFRLSFVSKENRYILKVDA